MHEVFVEGGHPATPFLKRRQQVLKPRDSPDMVSLDYA